MSGTRWCANFEYEECLEHGLQDKMWLMQYQYADGKHKYQSDRKSQITINWRTAGKIKPGDWLVAYCGQNTFHAVGRVIQPRRKKKKNDPAFTIEEYRKRKDSHHYKSGYVYYTDVLYENFSDDWRAPVEPGHPAQRYPQRIDVEEWLWHVPGGVVVHGLDALPWTEIIKAVFKIEEKLFQKILHALGGRLDELPFAAEVDPKQKYIEGATKRVTVNAYERDRNARAKCIKYHGLKCSACGFEMAELYGEFGEGVIHVHHLRELSSLNKEYEVDPENDLAPVCPNCHTILHTQSPAMSITDLRKLLANRKPVQWPRTK